MIYNSKEAESIRQVQVETELFIDIRRPNTLKTGLDVDFLLSGSSKLGAYTRKQKRGSERCLHIFDMKNLLR